LYRQALWVWPLASRLVLAFTDFNGTWAAILQ